MSEERASRLLPAPRSPAPLGRGKPRRERSFPRALTLPGAPGGWGTSVGKPRPRGRRGAWDAGPGEHLQGAGGAAAGPLRSGDAALILRERLAQPRGAEFPLCGRVAPLNPAVPAFCSVEGSWSGWDLGDLSSKRAPSRPFLA